jgi:alpha/beta superfamily hydrolase
LEGGGVKEEKVFVPSGGIQLQGLLSNQGALSSKGVVILCHPHPQYGGNMHNTVIATGVRTASEEGFATLRFNFRGVGESGGSYGEGIEERQDVRAAIDYVYSMAKNNDLPIVVLGYSFGAWASLPVAVEDRRVKGMVAIAPPLEMYDFAFLRECKKKKLLIAGDQDLFCPAPLLKRFYEDLEEPKSLAILPGVDHFFFSHPHSLIPPLKEFFVSGS